MLLAVSVLVLSRDVIFTLQVSAEYLFELPYRNIYLLLSFVARTSSEGGDYQDVALSHGNCV